MLKNAVYAMIYICYFRQNVSFQKKRIFFEKSVDKTYLMCYYIQVVWNGSLAQLGEHLPYKQRVTGSSPVAPIDLKLNIRWCSSIGRAADL